MGVKGVVLGEGRDNDGSCKVSTNFKSHCQLKSDKIIKIADTAKKIDFALLSILIDRCVKVNKTRLVFSNIHFLRVIK